MLAFLDDEKAFDNVESILIVYFKNLISLRTFKSESWLIIPKQILGFIETVFFLSKKNKRRVRN